MGWVRELVAVATIMKAKDIGNNNGDRSNKNKESIYIYIYI